jgi:peptidoglycan/xylan/chitin deacetylase (PgdA/CDA1 family)
MIPRSRESFIRVIDSALRRSPLQVVAQATTSRAAILAYHDIEKSDAFELHLQHVRTHCRPVSLEDVIAALGGAPLPARAVLVTFDDGDPSVFDVALPILRRYEIPAVAFVVTGLVATTQMLWTKEVRWLVGQGGRLAERPTLGVDAAVRYLKRLDDGARIDALEQLRGSTTALPTPAPAVDWADLRAIDEEGLLSIEDHALSHPQFDRCSPDHVREEIDRSIALFERKLGKRPRAFAYPDGARSDEAARVLASHGYQAAFMFDHRRARILGDDRWGISRLRVNWTTSLDRFATILSGLHPAIHRLRGRR